MNRGCGSLAVLGLVIVTGAVAQAQEAPLVQEDVSHAWNPALGVRVGGYGFRQLEEGGEVHWTDCRMDGSGLFGTLDLSSHFFVEGSFDFYAVSDLVLAEAGEMDRVSMHLQSALGFRMLTETALVPFLQVGGGAEWTRVQLRDGRSGDGWYPTGFFAFGVDYALGPHLGLGGSLRVSAMPHPVHEHAPATSHVHGLTSPVAATDTLSAPSASREEVRLEYAPAGQALFFVRYSL